MKRKQATPKTGKPKRESPLRIPLPFDQIVEGMLQVKPEKKPRGGRSRL